MTDYLGYTLGEYAPDAPATALHFERWFRNWEAGFEGAAGAPRLQPKALATNRLGAVRVVSTTAAGLTDIGWCRKIRMEGGADGTGGGALHVSFSANGGAAWGGEQALITPPGGGSPTFLPFASVEIDLVTGAVAGLACWAGTPTPGVSPAVIWSATLIVPANCNAVRWRYTGGAVTAVYAVYAVEGRAGV